MHFVTTPTSGSEVSPFNANGEIRPFDEIEADVFRIALDACGSVTVAARHLGIGRSTLYRKVQNLDEQAKVKPR